MILRRERAVNDEFDLLYELYTEDFMDMIQSEDFYQDFIEIARSGKTSASYLNRVVEKQIDMNWVEAIEEAIIPIDTIIRKPRRTIIQQEEIVGIELARHITSESIRHLAQHTNMIASVEDGNVTPNKILDIHKEETYEIYENRFLNTLLINLQYFISKRFSDMANKATGENINSVKFESKFRFAKEKVNFTMEITTSSPAFKLDKIDRNTDTSTLTKFQRVERIKSILNEFQMSPLIQSLRDTALVRPPIMNTNILIKDPNFKVIKGLWDYIETYRDAGFEIDIQESNVMPSEAFISDIYSNLVMNYAMMKHHCKLTHVEEAKVRKRVVEPKLMVRQFENLLDNPTLDLDYVQNIFLEEVQKVSRKRLRHQRQIEKYIDQALEIEADCIRREEAAIKAEKLAKAQLAAELRAKKKEVEEAARKLREQQKAELVMKREEALREKERIRKELAKEKARVRKQKELAMAKEKEKRAREKEKARIKKQKELTMAKEKEKRAREKEKARIKKQKELAMAKEKEKRAREKEKAGIK